jgi:hypothetical protein
LAHDSTTGLNAQAQRTHARQMPKLDEPLLFQYTIPVQPAVCAEERILTANSANPREFSFATIRVIRG